MSPRLAAPLFFVLSGLASLFFAPRLPDRVPLHWNLYGHPDRYGSPLGLLLLGPGLSLGLGALFLVLERIDPRLKNEDDAGPRRAVATLSLGLAALMPTLILAHLAGLFDGVNRPIAVAFAAFSLLLGNTLGRVRPNYFVGIRTPWTLSSDAVWRRTHRAGGWLLCAAGLVGLALAFALPDRLALISAVSLLVGSSIATITYSYWLWKREQAS